MKLATYEDGSRDGQLVVVSRDLQTAHYATHIATRLQQVLDDWNFLAPQLQDLAQTLDHGKARHAFAFEPVRCLAPLPRAAQWAEVQASRTVAPADSAEAPVQRPAGGVEHLAADGGLGAQAPFVAARGAGPFDVAPGWAVLTGDIEQGATPGPALEGVRLVMLTLAWHAVAPRLKGRQATLAQIGAGQRLPVACSPVAVTLDELGEAWAGGKLALDLRLGVDGAKAWPIGAADTALHAGQWLACLARHRRLGAGSVVSGGVVAGSGWAALGASFAGRRATEALEVAAGGGVDGATAPEWLQPGQTVRYEALDRLGQSVFGAIEQDLVGVDDESGSAPATSA